MNEKETNRLEAFSDGVFAVAITLLILNIGLPEADKLMDDAALWQALSDRWPAFLAYVISFLTIGVMWLNHHRLFTHIKRTNTPLMFINLLLLLIIVFIPFPTSLLADYIHSPNDHAAAVFYSGICLLMACCFNTLWRYASFHNRLLGKNVNEAEVKAISQLYLFGPLLYLIAFGLAWLNTIACAIFLLLLAILFAVPSRSIASLTSREKGPLTQEQEEQAEKLEA